MRVAALVSGGKDSILALHCAQATGWDVTHVVTVRSRAPDSYMFHVPNTDLAPRIAEALGLPLVAVETRGEKEAEVADLEAALASLPLDGFVSGAVASEYQRTRLEGIGHRLGLKSFTPLWHKRPEAILETVTQPGWDVRFAAVAAEGLDERWLGRRLDADAARELAALHERFGLHVAGEGGEYETLVLDAPCYQSRIVVEEARAEWRRDGGVWQVAAARLEPKPPSSVAGLPARA
ncbi:MAG: diphthine-ammonia ligase [Thermoplasmata archaeon]|nr:diphthine-ammonia ligase [Thermoplasmata archaeon]